MTNGKDGKSLMKMVPRHLVYYLFDVERELVRERALCGRQGFRPGKEEKEILLAELDTIITSINRIKAMYPRPWEKS